MPEEYTPDMLESDVKEIAETVRKMNDRIDDMPSKDLEKRIRNLEIAILFMFGIAALLLAFL